MLDNIDFKKLAEEMIARKLLGEAKSDVFAKKFEFDIRDYLGGLTLDPSAFRENAQKNLDIALLEEMFASLRGDTLQQTIENFNRSLGIVTTPEGDVVYAKEDASGNMQDVRAGPTSITAAFDALTIAGILRTIVGYDATTAGNLFEKIAAGLLGGFHAGGKDAFEDVTLPESQGGQKFSIKLLDPKTPIKGSIASLAINVAASDSAPVDFVVGQKSKDKMPYMVRFYRFSIDRSNFFDFIEKKGLDRKTLILDMLKRIRIKPLQRVGERESYQLMWVCDHGASKFPDAFAASEVPYPTYSGELAGENGAEDFFNLLSALKTKKMIHISGTKLETGKDTGESGMENNLSIVLNPQVVSTSNARAVQTYVKSFYNNVMQRPKGTSYKRDPLTKKINDQLKDLAGVAQALKQTPQSYWTPGTMEFLEGTYGSLNTLSAQSILKGIWGLVLSERPLPEANTFPNWKVTKDNPPPWGGRDVASPVKAYLVRGSVLAVYQDMIARKDEYASYFGLVQKVLPILSNEGAGLNDREKAFFHQLFGAGNADEILAALSKNLQAPSSQLVDLALGQTLSEAVAKPSKDTEDPDEPRPVGDSGFKVTASRVLEDPEKYKAVTDIPAIVLHKDMINKNAESRTGSLLQQIEPIFRSFHDIRVGLLRFYSGGEVQGMRDARSSTEELKGVLADVPEDFSQGQLAENKNPYTNSAVDDILDLL